jgi:hypothetical protein
MQHIIVLPNDSGRSATPRAGRVDLSQWQFDFLQMASAGSRCIFYVQTLLRGAFCHYSLFVPRIFTDIVSTNDSNAGLRTSFDKDAPTWKAPNEKINYLRWMLRSTGNQIKIFRTSLLLADMGWRKRRSFVMLTFTRCIKL